MAWMPSAWRNGMLESPHTVKGEDIHVEMADLFS